LIPKKRPAKSMSAYALAKEAALRSAPNTIGLSISGILFPGLGIACYRRVRHTLPVERVQVPECREGATCSLSDAVPVMAGHLRDGEVGDYR
jgi:hypothetical protein